MRQLSVISTQHSISSLLRRQLDGVFAIRTLRLDEFANEAPATLTLLDIDLDRPKNAETVRQWLQRRPKDGLAIFAVNGGSHIQTVRAYSMGATDVVFRPIRPGALLKKLLAKNDVSITRRRTTAIDKSNGIIAGITALQHMFLAAGEGEPLEPEVLTDAGDALVMEIERIGFAEWVHAVRAHHSQTYQHCLVVSGATAAFALQVGFRSADRRRVAIAGLLHDVGKAKVPVGILEKPSKLSEDEYAVVKRHAEFGHEILQMIEGLNPELLDMVLHHHEYLDGSGYPHGLQGCDISDLTRIVTICDIFGALIERRAYRAPMSGRAAYQILSDMGSKLDRDLVREFEPLSHAEFA